MAEPDLSEVISAAQSYGDTREAAARADEKDQADVRVSAVQVRLEALQDQYDAYVADHPDAPTPPAAKPLYGGNFGSGPDETRYVRPVTVARLFPGGGYPADLTTSSAYREAKAAGAKVVILDFSAGWTAAGVTATIGTAVKDGMVVLAASTHEPEHNNKMTPAAWVADQVRIAPVIRAAGGKVAPILQAATVAGVQGRVLSDYNLPKGTADYAGFDLYPDTQIISQDKLLPKIKAAAQSVFGCDQVVFGEYASKTVANLTAFQAWAEVNGVYAAAYWSQADYVLTAAAADAWFS